MFTPITFYDTVIWTLLAEYGTAIPFYLVMLLKGAMIQLWAAQKDLFLSPVVRQPLCFEVLENCSNLTFKPQSLILFAFAKVASTTAMIFIVFNSIFTGEDEYTIP